MILSFILKKEEVKRQASSSKQRLTMVQGSCRINLERYIMTKQYTYTKNEDGFMGSENRVENQPLNRIADALEEILRLVKEDQERSKKYMEERKDD